MNNKKEIKKICLNNCLDQIFQLFDDVLIISPNDKDILAAKLYVSGIKQANPKLIISAWHNTVTLKYKSQIDNGDYDFAIKNNYNNDIMEHYSSESSDYKYFEEMIEKIRSIVKTLDNDNKEKLVKYVQNISNLTSIYFENNE